LADKEEIEENWSNDGKGLKSLDWLKHDKNMPRSHQLSKPGLDLCLSQWVTSMSHSDFHPTNKTKSDLCAVIEKFRLCLYLRNAIMTIESTFWTIWRQLWTLIPTRGSDLSISQDFKKKSKYILTACAYSWFSNVHKNYTQLFIKNNFFSL
jgi:hypothetical protein